MKEKFIAEMYADALGPGVSCRWSGTDRDRMTAKLDMLALEGCKVAYTDSDGNVWVIKEGA